MEETKKKKKQHEKTLLGETNVKPSGQVIFPSLKEPAAEGVETWRQPRQVMGSWGHGSASVKFLQVSTLSFC